MMKHEAIALGALGTIKACESSASNALSKIKSLTSLIPITYGQKDELGQNVDSALQDICTSLQNNVINQLSSISDNSSAILASAKRKDYEEEIRRQLALKAKKDKDKPSFMEEIY